MFPLLQCLLKWSYLKGSGTLLRIAEGIKKHTLEGWVGLPIAKLLERNKVKRLSLFGSLNSNHREVNRQYYPTEQLRQSNAIKKNDSTHKA